MKKFNVNKNFREIFNIDGGRIITIVGKSGSGKSTLLQVIIAETEGYNSTTRHTVWYCKEKGLDQLCQEFTVNLGIEEPSISVYNFVETEDMINHIENFKDCTICIDDYIVNDYYKLLQIAIKNNLKIIVIRQQRNTDLEVVGHSADIEHISSVVIFIHKMGNVFRVNVIKSKQSIKFKNYAMLRKPTSIDIVPVETEILLQQLNEVLE